MALYSVEDEESVKISVKFPVDSSLDNFYDFSTEIRDFNGAVLMRSSPINNVVRTEIILPKSSCYLT